MKTYLRRRSIRLLLVTATILVVTGAGIAYATVPDGNGVIHGCRSKSTGAVRVIDTQAPQSWLRSCSSVAETALDWSQTGPPGSKGDKGDQGIQGIQGIQGVKGDKGDQGIQGVKGDQGIQGIQGVKGDKGDQGIQGIQGVKGDKGDQGIQGIQGVKGDQGDQGPSGTWPGTYLKKASTSIGTTSNGQVGVACDNGDKAVGGGFSLDFVEMQTIFSIPSDGGNNEGTTGWTARAYNPSFILSHTLTVYVLCANVTA